MTDEQRREAAELAARIDAAPHGSRRAMVEAAAATYGLSSDTLYRRLRAIRKPARKARADAGQTRRSEEAIRTVLALQEQTRRVDARTGVERRVPTEVALEEAKRRGLISEDLSRATVDRRAARLRMRETRKLYRPKRAEWPNDMHQLDASGSKFLRVVGRDERGEWLIGVKPKTGYTRKRADEPMGVWLVGLVDDCTGVQYLQYAVGPGESSDMVLDVLRTPWGGDPRCPIRGLPKVLNCDFGPFRSDKRMQNMLDGLGVEFLRRMPDSPTVSGKAENRWRTLWRRFEATYLWTPERVMLVGELNQDLGVYVAAENERHHAWDIERRRIDLYQSGLAHVDVRLMPEDLGQAIFSGTVRKVYADASFRWNNTRYRVDDALAGCWVEANANQAGEVVARNAETGEVYAAIPAEPTTWDVFEPRHYTPAQWLEQDAAQIAPAETGHWTPEGGRIVVMHTPGAREVTPDTPFRRAEMARTFTNEEEAFDRAVVVIGAEKFLGRPDLAAIVREQIRVFKLDKARLEDAWLELRDMGA